MYREDFKKVSGIGKAKAGWLKENPIGYFVAAMVAGMFISFGSFVAMTIGGMATAAAKSALDAGAMFVRGILCNICVCLAVWCSVRMKSESGKLIMVIWCILIFMLCGFEHSVANMSIIGQVLIHGGAPGVSLPLYLKSLLFVSAGNIVGGVGFVALPYAVMAQKKN